MLLTPRILYQQTLLPGAVKCTERAQPASVHREPHPHLIDQETLKSIHEDTQMVRSAYFEGAF